MVDAIWNCKVTVDRELWRFRRIFRAASFLQEGGKNGPIPTPGLPQTDPKPTPRMHLEYPEKMRGTMFEPGLMQDGYRLVRRCLQQLLPLKGAFPGAGALFGATDDWAGLCESWGADNSR